MLGWYLSRLNIKPFQWDNECLHGFGYGGEATAFPQALGLAASFEYFSSSFPNNRHIESRTSGGNLTCCNAVRWRVNKLKLLLFSF